MTKKQGRDSPRPIPAGAGGYVYRVVFHCHNGMSIPMTEALSYADAAEFVKGLNRRRRRQGFEVYKLNDRNNCWEHVREDAGLIGDDQGILSVTRQREQ